MNDLTPSLLESAAAWRLRLANADFSTEERSHLEDWLNADPQHRRAFEQVQAAWGSLDDCATDPAVVRMRRDALDHVQKMSRSRKMHGGRRRMLLAAAAVLVLAVIAGLLVPFFNTGRVYRTGVNEREVVTLSDGSRVHLDAASELSVHYSNDVRALRLIAGQAYFEVAHDVSRPFKVKVRDRTVIATGTAFNIDIVGRQVAVTLIKGHVVVVDAQNRVEDLHQDVPMQPIHLSPGDQLITVADGPIRIRPFVDAKVATAWERNQLVFDNESLSEAAARVDRYSNQKIVVDNSVAGLRISGVFNTGDVQAFVEGVTAELPVVAARTASGKIILHHSSGPSSPPPSGRVGAVTKAR